MNRFFYDGHWTVFVGLVLAAMLWVGLTIDRSEPLLIQDQYEDNWTN